MRGPALLFYLRHRQPPHRQSDISAYLRVMMAAETRKTLRDKKREMFDLWLQKREQELKPAQAGCSPAQLASFFQANARRRD